MTDVAAASDAGRAGVRTAPTPTMVNAAVQRACVWAGPGMAVLLFIGFFLLAGFLPPPSPNDSADEIAALFRDDTDLIRLGMVITTVSASLLVPWAVVIALQVRRIEGPGQVLALIQLAQGTLVSFELILPAMVWQTAAYRPSSISPELVRTLNDFGWLLFVGVVASVIAQLAVIGVAILLDRGPRPVFPRWAGYLNIWAAVSLAPAAFVVLFKSGPFAWRGLIAFWLAVVAFFVWMVVMVFVLRRAIDQQVAEA